MPLWLPRTLSLLEWFVGLGAAAGGAALTATPSGAILHMPVSLLRGSPFSNYLVPGLVLLLVVGGSNLVAGYLTWRGDPRSCVASMCAGFVLIVWILAEIAFIGYVHWAQAAYLAFGLITVALAAMLPRPPQTRL